MKRLVFAVVLLGVWATSASAGELTLDADFPMVGVDQIVTVADVERADSLRLWVIYSPNSETQSEEEIGQFSSDGVMTWNPTRFGIATLSARDDGGGTVVSENVAVLFAKTPTAGVLVMLFAGVLLFGGAGLSLRSVLSSGVPEYFPPIDT